ncbi:hypothetical protein Clacol_008694 [Clathrus columnatus]|uniref:Zn(2)-C6 fungal-type domain-containing protein n=1 Tax=Clathrus columnatus TaxID=1419009 RepID=A0AAV5AJ81_9AGAM|nr:hypothetical protein Clacol_008694 [Clathrus columnatus]
MKCEFVPPDAPTCKRCKSGGHQCIVEGRKPRTGPNKREFLLAQLRQKESIIESLLRQINNPVHQTPLTLLVPNMSTVASNTNSNGTTNANLQSIQTGVTNTSVKNAGGRGGLAAFSLDKRAEGTSIDLLEDEDADEPGIRRHFEDDADADGGEDDDDADDGADPSVSLGGSGKKAKLHYLPEEAAPLGLIADLSLENHTPKKKDREKEKEREGSAGAGAKDDAGSQYHSEPRGQSAVPANAGTGQESSNPNDLSAPQGAAVDANQQPPAEEENENNVGVANKSYFHPGPATDLNLRRVIAERTMPPDILVHGLVTPEDVEELFKILRNIVQILCTEGLHI